MRIRPSFDGLVKVVLTVAAAGVLDPSAAFAQRENLPLDLPNGPAKPGFDIKRFSNAGNGWFKTFYVTETQRSRRQS
jgi:hypothetical protein